MAEDRLSRFVNLALLEHQAITDRFRFHPLLQSFARQKANVWDVYSKAIVTHRRFFSRYVRTRAAYTAENLAALVAEQDAIMMVARERVREGEFDLAFIKGLNTLLEQTGQWEIAIDLAEMALNKSSVLDNWTQAVLLLQRGKHRQIQGDLDVAIADFKESLSIGKTLGDQRHVAMVLNSLGGAKRDQGDLDAAIADFKESLSIGKALGNQRSVAMVLNSLGGAKRDQGDFDAAIADFERSLEIREVLGDRRGIAMVLNSLGCAWREKGEIDKSINAYEQCRNIRLADGKSVLQVKGARARSRLQKLRKWKRELDGCKTDEERHHCLARYHLKMGCGRFEGGDNHGARLHFERALALGLEPKEQAECWFHLGRTHTRLKQHAQAIQAFRASLEFAEGSTVLYASLGHSLHEAGASFDEIKTTFERAFEKDKNNSWAHSWYALALKDNGQLEPAERHARKAVDIEPNNSVLLTNLGQVLMAYEALNKLKEAETKLERAQKLATPGFQWPAIHLAAVRERLVRLDAQHENEH